jgi:hypothetical protein
MDLKKKFILPAIMIMALGLALAGGAYVKAQATTSDGGIHKTIIQRLVERFNLNTADVQAVFDAERADRQAQMTADFNTKLDALVTSGALTDAQKQAILTKRQELQSQEQSETNGQKPTWTPGTKPTQEQIDAMKAKMEARKQDIETWAKQNGIDAKYLYLLGGFGHEGHGHGFGRMMGEPPASN